MLQGMITWQMVDKLGSVVDHTRAGGFKYVPKTSSLPSYLPGSCSQPPCLPASLPPCLPASFLLGILRPAFESNQPTTVPLRVLVAT